MRPAPKQALHNRLLKIEGQVRGIDRMIADDATCLDVLVQISAATHALQSVAIELLDTHLRACLSQADGSPPSRARLDETAAAIARLVRS